MIRMASEIPLTQGYVALVDDEDYDRVNQFKWSAHVQSHTVYAVRSLPRINGKQPFERMHRFILDAPDGMEVDHKNGNGWDNTRANLRLATRAENRRNKRRSRNNTSAFIGVYWDKDRNKWRAKVNVNRKQMYAGLFDSPEEAARARDKLALELHGEFAMLNFPEEVDYECIGPRAVA